MRLKNLLTFFVLLSVSLGMRAADISGTGISGATDNSSGKKVQTLVINTPGALATWVAAHTGDNYVTNNPFEGLGGSNDFYSLKISGELNADDLAALNSTTCAAFSRFPRIDMSEVTLAEETTSKDVCSVVFGPASFQKNNETITGNGATFIVLPNGITSADDVTLMGKMKAKGNSALKVVGAYDGSNATLPELALYSFQENELSNFSSQMMNLADKAMVARLAGTYGDKDLVNNTVSVFGYTPPCIWDFTGATFTSCSLNPGVQTSYHAYNDPFCDGPTSKPGDDYQTNAFFYFSNYCKMVVDIKLPTGNTELPPLCLNMLGGENIKNAKHKAAYLAHYGISESEMTENYAIDNNCALIPTLTIPDNYTKLDYQCGQQSYIQHLVIGGGMKIVEGGAFYNCIYLEDLDFGSGLSNCYLGEDAFRGQNNSVMKHIALSEGIVSLGANCFMNAQQLESIRLPQSLINIGDHAFDNCLALNSITIPENVNKIGKDTFRLCPFTDIYLTTTDPNKIPIIFTGGNNFNNWGTSSFYNGHYDGWTQLPSSADDKTNVEKFTWDEAVEWYFVHCNGIPVLHYPKQLANKVKSYISTYYHAHSKDGKGLPMQSDMNLRATADGANVGTSGQGRYTRDGWAQFMLMEEYDPNTEDEVYSKEYDDVWYTMCFPFDLTDEQLAAAFNETFNIVDFSGVEIRNEDNGTKNLVLHFNTVALTTYKDNDGNIYQRKMSGGKPIREVDTDKFEYNVYLDKDGNEYHHSIVSDKLGTNKTKTFAKGYSLAEAKANKNNAIVIDGILAEAGHPYMIHPAIGINTGEPMKRCYFSGIKWLDNNERAAKYEERKRVVNLSVGKGTVTDDMKTCVPSADNYLQKEYSQYANQTYTFKGNYKVFKDGTAESVASEGPEPVVPKKPEEPTRPDDPDGENSPFTAEDKTMPSEQIPSPAPTAPTREQRGIYYLVTSFWGIYDEITCNANQQGNEQWDVWNNRCWELQNNDYGINVYSEAGFNTCKEAFNITKKYVKYEKIIEQWNAYNAYIAAKDAYQNYNPSTAWSDYENELDAYNTALENHQKWENKVGKYKPLIPKGAYFLGRRGRGWPKFYREIADDTRTNPTGGFWTQYTAIIEPNSDAIAGIEHELDAGIANNTKGLNMVFDEGFMGEFEANEIKEIVAEAEEKGQKVQYMNIVYSINGEVVGRGSHSLSNLPQGMYIINGKKYLVK